MMILLFTGLLSAASQQGLPTLISYDKEDYSAGRQNWDVETGPNGIVYFANTEGLLYHIYGEWGLVPLSMDQELRCLYAEKDTIWSGGEELGCFTRKDGVLEYQTLDRHEGGIIWNIEPAGREILFRTENILHFLDRSSGAITSISYPEGIWTIKNWNDRVWIFLRDGQIGYLEGRKYMKVSQDELFRNKEIRMSFIHDEQLYLLMFDGGLYVFDGTQVREFKLPGEITEGAFFSGMSYDEESFCLGTISDGFALLSHKTGLLQHIHAENGLPDNSVLSMAADELGSVWLGLDYGIARVELQSPISSVFQGAASYSYTPGEPTSYLATNQGLFLSQEEGPYRLYEELAGQTWKIKEIDGAYYVCHNSGVYLKKGNAFIQMADFSGFMDLVRFRGSELFIASTYHGLVLLRRWGNRFQHLENLNLWGNVSLAWDETGNCIWAGFRDDPVLKLELSPENALIRTPFEDRDAVYHTEKGVFFRSNGKLFGSGSAVQDEAVASLLETADFQSIQTLEFSPEGYAAAWVDASGLHLNMQLPDGKIYAYDALLASQSGKLIPEYESLKLEGKRLFFCTDKGLSVFDFSHQTSFQKHSRPLITSMEILNEEGKKHYHPFPEEGLSLEAGNKDLLFRVGVNRSSNDVAEFRYILEGLDESWSDWSMGDTELLFPQLKGGDYLLKVQCRINSGDPNVTELKLQIDKLWYQSWLLAIPIVLFVSLWMLAIVLFMARRSRRKLESQKQHYRQKNARRTLEMKNEQLLQYTEIISHKNEFLNRVKEGLEKMRNADAQQWVNLISEEVNNEKKEFLFHKVFSEVHQDFISRLGEGYPDLTSNDVRMLSFIRINLDKREICSLMNISPRSLDTVRYRLRKKLELEKDIDLDQFIREF